MSPPIPRRRNRRNWKANWKSCRREFDEIENQIRTASPKYAALTAAQPVSLADIQQKVLDDHTALLEYSLGNDQSYLWVVTRSGVALFKLPARSTIEKLATDFRAQLIPSKLQRRIVGIDVVADQQRGIGVATGTRRSEHFDRCCQRSLQGGPSNRLQG